MTACASCSPIRVDYAKAASNVVLANAGNILVTNLTEILRVRVPDLGGPVLLDAECVAQVSTPASGVNGDTYIGWAPVPAAGGNIPAATMIRAQYENNVGGTTAEPGGRTFRPCVWLPANSPGDYALGGFREAGSEAVTVVVNTIALCEAWAERG